MSVIEQGMVVFPLTQEHVSLSLYIPRHRLEWWHPSLKFWLQKGHRSPYVQLIIPVREKIFVIGIWPLIIILTRLWAVLCNWRLELRFRRTWKKSRRNTFDCPHILFIGSCRPLELNFKRTKTAWEQLLKVLPAGGPTDGESECLYIYLTSYVEGPLRLATPCDSNMDCWCYCWSCHKFLNHHLSSLPVAGRKTWVSSTNFRFCSVTCTILNAVPLKSHKSLGGENL